MKNNFTALWKYVTTHLIQDYDIQKCGTYAQHKTLCKPTEGNRIATRKTRTPQTVSRSTDWKGTVRLPETEAWCELRPRPRGRGKKASSPWDWSSSSRESIQPLLFYAPVNICKCVFGWEGAAPLLYRNLYCFFFVLSIRENVKTQFEKQIFQGYMLIVCIANTYVSESD